MPRGVKTCPKCQTANGPRSHVCKQCEYAFVFKPQSKEKKNTKIIQNVNWRDLVKGDRIKVKGGPYFENNGEIIRMGYKGKFVVQSIDANGIIATGIDKHSGYAHIYMGEDKKNPETNVWKVKHRIVKLAPKKVVADA